jgi:hypothetical protein
MRHSPTRAALRSSTRSAIAPAAHERTSSTIGNDHSAGATCARRSRFRASERELVSQEFLAKDRADRRRRSPAVRLRELDERVHLLAAKTRGETWRIGRRTRDAAISVLCDGLWRRRRFALHRRRPRWSFRSRTQSYDRRGSSGGTLRSGARSADLKLGQREDRRTGGQQLGRCRAHLPCTVGRLQSMGNRH